MQKADKEAAMNRDANAAAIAALGTSRSLKRPAPGVTGANSNMISQVYQISLIFKKLF